MANLYRFHWDCGRMGDVESVFAAEPEEVKAALGKQVYFGEILGKHSEVNGVLGEEDLTLLTEDSEFVRKAIEYGVVPVGHNPLSYLNED